MRSVCYAGTYERAYPRNSLMIQALRDAGVRVEESHQPVFERSRDKSALGVAGMLLLALRLLLAYLRLIPDVGLRLLRCDALVIGYIGQLDVLVLGTVARIAGRPVVFNPLVSLTDTLVEDRHTFRADSLPGRLVRQLDRVSLNMADLVLADTHENADYFATHFNLDRNKIAVVQVGVPEEMFYLGRFESEPAKKMDVLFVGKFIPLHGVDTILRAAAILQQREFPARIEMVGTGQDYLAARDLAERLALGNIVWTDWIAFDGLGDRLRAADVVLGIFDQGAKAGRVIPNKVHQALACGATVITRASPAIERHLTDGVEIVLVPPADPEALADAIESLLGDEQRRAIGAAGLRSWSKWGSRRALSGQVQHALERLADSR